MIVLINPEDPKEYKPSEGYEDLVYLGAIGYLDAALRQEGIKSKIIDAKNKAYSVTEIVDASGSSDIAAISCHWGTISFVEQVSHSLKSKNKKIIVGGSLPSSYGYTKDNLFMKSIKNIDYCVIGEGEQTLPELIKYINKERNILPAGVLERTPEGINLIGIPAKPSKFENLIIDYSRFPDFLSSARNKTLGIQTARGCYANCTFCYKLTGKALIREIPLDLASNEITELVERVRPRQVRFYEEELCANKERAILLSSIMKKKRLPFTGMTRVDDIDLELACTLKENGINEIHVGIESFDPIVRANLKKNIKQESIEKLKEYAEKANLVVVGFLMAGLPGETKSTYDLTFKIIKDWPTLLPRIRPLMPIPGTKIYSEAVLKEIVNEAEFFENMKNGFVDSIQNGRFLINLSHEIKQEELFEYCSQINRIRKERINHINT